MKKIKAIIWLIVFILLGLIEALLSPLIKIVSVFLIIFGSGKYKQYGINVWEGIDNAVSSRLGGDPDESISSRLGKARSKGSKGWSFIADRVDLVFDELFNFPNHCDRTTEHDEGRKQVTKY